MVSQIRLGVLLPFHAAYPGAALGDVGQAARHAEELGLDSVWVGDHLTTGHPLIESTVALSYAAAVTQRVKLGTAVMVPALRQPAWAAKQLASLQYVSSNRLVLGVGVGVAGTGEWGAAGVPSAGRARRTDRFLAALPKLFNGEPTALTTAIGQTTVTLAPAVPLPEVWIGGTSDAALTRAASFGKGWLAALLAPDQLARRTARLRDLAHTRGMPAPATGTMVFAHLTERPVNDPSAPVKRFLTDGYGLEPAHAGEVAVGGTPEQAAEQLSHYALAGASELVIIPFGQDNWVQYELLAEVRSILVGS